MFDCLHWWGGRGLLGWRSPHTNAKSTFPQTQPILHSSLPRCCPSQEVPSVRYGTRLLLQKDLIFLGLSKGQACQSRGTAFRGRGASGKRWWELSLGSRRLAVTASCLLSSLPAVQWPPCCHVSRCLFAGAVSAVAFVLASSWPLLLHQSLWSIPSNVFMYSCRCLWGSDCCAPRDLHHGGPGVHWLLFPEEKEEEQPPPSASHCYQLNPLHHRGHWASVLQQWHQTSLTYSLSLQLSTRALPKTSGVLFLDTSLCLKDSFSEKTFGASGQDLTVIWQYYYLWLSRLNGCSAKWGTGSILLLSDSHPFLTSNNPVKLWITSFFLLKPGAQHCWTSWRSLELDLCSIHVGEWCKLTRASNLFSVSLSATQLVFSSPSARCPAFQQSTRLWCIPWGLWDSHNHSDLIQGLSDTLWQFLFSTWTEAEIPA